jgi:hypothetical protein
MVIKIATWLVKSYDFTSQHIYIYIYIYIYITCKIGSNSIKLGQTRSNSINLDRLPSLLHSSDSSCLPFPFLKSQVPQTGSTTFILSLSLSLSKHLFFFFNSLASILPQVSRFSTLHLLCSRALPFCNRLVVFLDILKSWRLVSEDGFAETNWGIWCLCYEISEPAAVI